MGFWQVHYMIGRNSSGCSLCLLSGLWKVSHRAAFFSVPPCVRLQDPSERDLWELHQRSFGGHHGTLGGWEVYINEHSSRL